MVVNSKLHRMYKWGMASLIVLSCHFPRRTEKFLGIFDLPRRYSVVVLQ
jgi:hypothetical protein